MSFITSVGNSALHNGQDKLSSSSCTYNIINFNAIQKRLQLCSHYLQMSLKTGHSVELSATLWANEVVVLVTGLVQYQVLVPVKSLPVNENSHKS